MKIRWKPLLIHFAISLGVAGLSALSTMNSMGLYQSLNRPPLSPPGWLFGVVWTILFVLMGLSAYLVWITDSEDKKPALRLYGIQLAVNFVWSILFFCLQAYWFAFLWLLLLWVLIIAMIIAFMKVSFPAAMLQIPYLLWVTFAGYLSLFVALLN